MNKRRLDITGPELRLRNQLITDYLCEGFPWPDAIRHADIDMRIAEHYGIIDILLGESPYLKLTGCVSQSFWVQTRPVGDLP
jgi:hypothetical protein